jgi:hypothetical protein
MAANLMLRQQAAMRCSSSSGAAASRRHCASLTMRGAWSPRLAGPLHRMPSRIACLLLLQRRRGAAVCLDPLQLRDGGASAAHRRLWPPRFFAAWSPPRPTLSLRPHQLATAAPASRPSAARAPLRVRAAADPQQQQPPAAAPQQPGAPPGERQVVYNTEFGYSRKDIFLIGGGLIGLGYAMYYGLQATGMEPGIAGNWVQATIFLGICVGWVSTYLYRVATKVGGGEGKGGVAWLGA